MFDYIQIKTTELEDASNTLKTKPLTETHTGNIYGRELISFVICCMESGGEEPITCRKGTEHKQHST